ncbi:MAG: ribosomal protein S18-alanine N-acetyltransferase [Anaerolineales bacterium]|jgi:ribosomal-protein-alanine N-acetyltransferase|nr:ribosomal protein S18-alanine N-acetyltransferase [Chloroflexota bacterium]MBK6644803.1 ribosomal protein S18-alanine N-acetyltransferase [Anaerolineales bacterium]MCC6986117.1 ribosomal protein S18-alanine N-acetyltransferase [Anaerolineales bacterium]
MNSIPQTSSGDLPGLHIRKMTEDDLEQVVAIDQVSFTLPWPLSSFHFEVKDNLSSRHWVAEMDGRILAMMVGWLIVDELHVATIATHPDYRGRGIGARLLVHALISARQEGVGRAFLEVREGNAVAMKMYRGLGFVEDGRREGYYADNHEDAILMSLNDLGRLQGE